MSLSAYPQKRDASFQTCPICATPDVVRPAFERDGLNVARCSACGVEFLDPQPDDAALEQIYSANYFFGANGAAAAKRQEHLKSATARLYLDMLGKAAPAQNRLLEIGCGTGDFLVAASQRGYDVFGIEISPTSTATAAGRIGPNSVICGTLNTLNLVGASFDVVANSDVVEHVRDPRAFVSEIFRVLKPGGRVLTVTPSLESWSRRLMGTRWMEYKLEHLYYFGRRSLRKLLADSGFVDIRIVPNVKVLSLDYVARHFERFSVPAFSPAVIGIRKVLPEALVHRPVRIVASGMTATARKP